LDCDVKVMLPVVRTSESPIDAWIVGFTTTLAWL
jgi:hypothetical protein